MMEKDGMRSIAWHGIPLDLDIDVINLIVKL
jgi:hypothetical protein